MNKTFFIDKHGDAERPSLMWFWGDLLTPEDIVFQIEKFKEAGIDEFYVHPGHGDMGTNYLSDEYNKCIRLACDTAERLGIRYSIYDEFAWSSGSCAGRIPAEFPEYRMTMLHWFFKQAMVAEPVEILFKGKVLAVQVQYADKECRREDITDKVKIEYFENSQYGRVFWDNDKLVSTKIWVFCQCPLEGISPTSQWSPYATNKPGFTDTMNPAAVRKFFELNHEVYKKTVGDRFGKSIKHIFTDETSLGDFGSETRRPYSSVLEEEFKKEHGYALSDNYIAITGAFETDEDLKVRHDYHKTLTRLFCTAYLDQYADWCHKNNLLLTGHMSGGGILYYQTMQHGDFYEALSRFDIPGMDHILSKAKLQNPNWTPYKQIASVAKFADKKKTFCETFTGSGWDLTLEDAKHIINRLMMQGISHIMYMGAFYSMNEGNRKDFPCAYPPSHSFQNPLFKHYKALSDYSAVRASVMSQTTPIGSTLVFTPQVDAWAHVSESVWSKTMNITWHNCSYALYENSIDYDYFYEPLTPDTKVENGVIDIRGFKYDTLIIPHTGCSNEITLAMIEKFAQQGGKLVFINKFPNKAIDTCKKFDFASICGLSEKAKNFFGDASAYGVLSEGNVLLIKTGPDASMPLDTFCKDLTDFVNSEKQAETVDASSLPQGVVITRRQAEGIYSCFVYNDSQHTHTVKLNINGNWTASLLRDDVLYDCEINDGAVSFEVAPYDMPVLILTADGITLDGIEKTSAPTIPTGDKVTLTLDKGWTFKPEKANVLPLRIKYLMPKEPDKTISPELISLAETANVPYACFEYPSTDDVKFGGGYAAYARFEVKDIPAFVEMFSEVDGDGEIWLNGQLVTGFKKVIEFGPHDSVTDVTSFIKKGTNTVLMISRIQDWKGPHKMPWVCIRGDFVLDEGDVIAAPKSEIDVTRLYTTQGWRYFGGDVVYSNTFNLDKIPSYAGISLKTNEVAEVIINGKSAGIHYWKPYEADITSLCQKGENTVDIRITTTLEPTMVLEEIVLCGQGFAEYREEVSAKTVGLLAAPEIIVKK